MKSVSVSPTLEKAVRDKIEATLEICRRKYGKPFPMPPLEFRQCGRIAGFYRPPSSFWGKPEMLVINPDYFKNHYDEQLNVTVPHEVAHYVTEHVFGKVKHHGWEWKSVMRVIGLPAADRCHQFSLEGVKTRNVAKPFQYECGCITHNVTKQKHLKCQANVARYGKTGYRCLKCRKPLVYRGFMNGSTFVPAMKPTDKPIEFVQVFNILPVVPKPIQPIVPALTVTERQPTFRMVTKFVGGSLINVKVPISV